VFLIKPFFGAITSATQYGQLGNRGFNWEVWNADWFWCSPGGRGQENKQGTGGLL